MEKNKTMSKAETIIRATLTVLLLLAFLFMPAGTLNWPEAWIFVLLYFSIVSGVLLWLKKNSPGLLKERTAKKKDYKLEKKKLKAKAKVERAKAKKPPEVKIEKSTVYMEKGKKEVPWSPRSMSPSP